LAEAARVFELGDLQQRRAALRWLLLRPRLRARPRQRRRCSQGSARAAHVGARRTPRFRPARVFVPNPPGDPQCAESRGVTFVIAGATAAFTIGGGFEYGASVTSPMRPSGLEPPRGNLPTRPSTSYTPARCVRRRPNRPLCGVSRTHRTHLEWRLLPRCCHGSGLSRPGACGAPGRSAVGGAGLAPPHPGHPSRR